MAGDHTQAAALHLAKAHLEKMGWKYTAEDIGSTARQILERLNPTPTPNPSGTRPAHRIEEE